MTKNARHPVSLPFDVEMRRLWLPVALITKPQGDISDAVTRIRDQFTGRTTLGPYFPNWIKRAPCSFYFPLNQQAIRHRRDSGPQGRLLPIAFFAASPVGQWPTHGWRETRWDSHTDDLGCVMALVIRPRLFASS